MLSPHSHRNLLVSFDVGKVYQCPLATPWVVTQAFLMRAANTQEGPPTQGFQLKGKVQIKQRI